MYLADGKTDRACDTLDRLVEIDAYDSRNLQRMRLLEKPAAPNSWRRSARGFRSRRRTVLPRPARAIPSPRHRKAGRRRGEALQNGLEDLMVQAEIFIQYSLQAKAVERLKRIAELYPGEEERNERLLNLYQLANWWPEGARAKDASRCAARLRGSGRRRGRFGRRDARSARISEISKSVPAAVGARHSGRPSTRSAATCRRRAAWRSSARRQAATTGLGVHRARHGAGARRASGAFARRIGACRARCLGGLPLDAAASPALREMKVETALGVVLTDRDTQSRPACSSLVTTAPHAWRPNETYFLQAVGDQMLLSVNHTRLRALARNLGTVRRENRPVGAQLLSGLPGARIAAREDAERAAFGRNPATQPRFRTLAASGRSATRPSDGTARSRVAARCPARRSRGEIYGVVPRIYFAGHQSGRRPGS